MDFLARTRAHVRRRIGAVARSGAALALLVWSASAVALGTGAGARIDSAAQMTFDVAGVAQPGVTSNTVTVAVDEVLDAVVVDQDAAPVSVASGATGAWLSFSVTNTGNGSEPFRLVVDSAISGDDFDPTSPAIYVETNGTPGLQIGAGGDTPYAVGSNDPVLVRDTSVSIYVASNIPVGLAQGSAGRISLRAVPRTVVTATGTDDPANAAFPSPGTAYPGAGDPALGGGNVVAVVGSTFASGALRLRAEGAYRVDAAVVTLNKVVTSVTDPTGGARLVPGAGRALPDRRRRGRKQYRAGSRRSRSVAGRSRIRGREPRGLPTSTRTAGRRRLRAGRFGRHGFRRFQQHRRGDARRRRRGRRTGRHLVQRNHQVVPRRKS